MPEDNPSLENGYSPQQKKNRKIYLKPGLRALCVLLVIVVIAIVFMWRPWEPYVRSTDRTVSVTGTSTITATPDEYVFSPEYDFTEANQQTAISDLTQKSSQLTAHLKSLGVANKDIQSNSDGYGNNGLYVSPGNSSGDTYNLYLEITVDGSSLAQKVQNYLLTTSPTGQVSPTAQFSNVMQQNLQNQARQKAEQNARSQAEESAKNLGFNIGAVKSVNDSNNNEFGLSPLEDGINSAADGATSSSSPQLSLQPGQNQLSYSVTVVYYIK